MRKSSAPRFLALDVLRGLTVCFMIIVNTQGSGAAPFSPLEHATWHGFTPTDLVFPTFLFVVGNAMAFSMGKSEMMSNSQAIWKFTKRACIIFLLGYLIYWFPFVAHSKEGWHVKPISHTRILGVLQRIGICYLIASLMIRFLSTRAVWGLSILFLLGYWVIMAAWGDYTLTGNAGLKLDKLILGDAHMYHGEGIAFDPEGILSTIPSVVNVIIGYYAGVFIRKHGNTDFTVSRLMITGASMVAIAYFWHLLFPINKKLWTSPFVFYTCGLDLLILGTLIYIIEIRNRKKWTGFFEVFGKNPLAIYILSELIAILLYTFTNKDGRSWYQLVNKNFFQKIAPGAWGALFFALAVMLTCWVAGWWMDRKKIYIRV
ncbi:acyltransferase family protein [Pollutibacter soli]|uniref:acyltransferase family protein n=1 Tax=Pollutibacter soli TaxID=3034157 RepID=UPI003013BD99